MRTEPLLGAAATVPFVRTAPRLAEARSAAGRKRSRQDVVAPEAIEGIPDANDPTVGAAIAAAHEAREACSMPPRPMKGFETGQARQDAWVHAAAERLAEVLPASAGWQGEYRPPHRSGVSGHGVLDAMG